MWYVRDSTSSNIQACYVHKAVALLLSQRVDYGFRSQKSLTAIEIATREEQRVVVEIVSCGVETKAKGQQLRSNQAYPARSGLRKYHQTSITHRLEGP